MLLQQIKLRSRFASLLLAFVTFFIPGVGQLFGGKFGHAVIWFTLSLILNVVLAITNIMDQAYSAFIAFAFIILFSLYISFDAFKINSAKQGVSLKWYNKWYYYLFFILCFIVVKLFSPNVSDYCKSFNIPSGDNIPTLQIGDVLIGKLQNKYNTSSLSSDYKIGSLIIFTVPDRFGEASFVKRLIAQGGDTFFIKNGTAYLNNNVLDESYVLPSHKIKPESKNFGPVTVPSGYVFF